MTSSGNRQKIVLAAQRLFAEHGYAMVSVDEVAAAAGLTKGAVYYSFRDKRDLFRAACIALLDAIVHQVEGTTMAQVDHSLDEIITGGERLFDAYENPRARRLLLIDGPAVLGVAEWSALQERLRVELGEHALGHLADAGLIAPGLIPMMAHLLFGAFTQGVLQIAASHDPAATSKTVRAAYRRLAMGLLASGHGG